MKIDITINKKACEEIKRLIEYRLFKLGLENPCKRVNYSHQFISYEVDVLKKLLEMLNNLEIKKELIL
jgi:hypothetical protein